MTLLGSEYLVVGESSADGIGRLSSHCRSVLVMPLRCPDFLEGADEWRKFWRRLDGMLDVEERGVHL